VDHAAGAPPVSVIVGVTSSSVVIVVTRGARTEEEDQIRCAGQVVRRTDQ
jgi:hypothetical protein